MTFKPLIGREAECGRIAGLLDAASERGAALLVRGAAGVGKSALLVAAAERAPLLLVVDDAHWLAAEGLSNREIGRRLYLSHRTVESHLYHAFPKLGINSRAQLREHCIQLTSTEVSGEH